MADVGRLWILPVLWTLVSGQFDFKPTSEANMDTSDCDRNGPYMIGDSDIMHVYANPPQRPGSSSSRDHCIVQVRAPENQRLRVYIFDVSIADCGTTVELYDSTTHMVSPERTLDCDSKPTQFNTRTSGLTIRLVKFSVAANIFRYNIVLTTDRGPDINFEKEMSSYNPNALSIGAIIGISIAGGLLLLALIAIFIWCIVTQRKKNMETYKEEPRNDPTVYTSGASKVVFPSHKHRNANSYDSRETSSNDSHNSSISSGDGHNFVVNMNPDPKGKPSRRDRGYYNTAYVPSEDGGTHDRSRDSTGSEDTVGGHVNASFESNETPRTAYKKKQENGHSNGSISRSGRSGSAKGRSNRKRSSSSDDKRHGSSRDRGRGRSSSGSRSGHRDSARRRSRSHGEHGGSQRRSRSRSPHSQSSRDSYFDKEGRNREYNISNIARRSRDHSNSSTSSRDSENDRNVSLDPNPSRSRRRDRDYGDYGSQV